MRHATAAALDQIDALLQQIREVDGLVEKKRGIWYRKSKAFLHFHEDPAGIFADVKLDGDFERFPANSQREKRELVRRIRQELGRTS